jgi:hypothetical protein
MKKIHLLNIGLPKTGTSWLFREIGKQNWFDQKNIQKEIQIFQKKKNLSDYINLYSKFNYSANFNNSSYILGAHYIESLKSIKSCKISIILRNPYEYFWSFYQQDVKENFNNKVQKDFLMWAHDLIEIKAYSDWSKSINRWLRFFPNLKIFYYDELKKNPIKFYLNYSEQMNLPESKNISTTPNNVNSFLISKEIKYDFIKKNKNKIEIILTDLKNNKNLRKDIIENWFDINKI